MRIPDVDRAIVAGEELSAYLTGNTVAVVTLPAIALRRPTTADRPAARVLSA
jgi:hypothetical protein